MLVADHFNYILLTGLAEKPSSLWLSYQRVGVALSWLTGYNLPLGILLWLCLVFLVNAVMTDENTSR